MKNKRRDLLENIILLGLILVVFFIGRFVGNKQVPVEPKPKPELWRVTAYCPCELCCKGFSDGITASGHRIAVGDKFVAAPPNIPFGTLVSIPGYHRGLPVPVRDRGGSIKGKRLDIYFDTHQEALDWGIQYLEVTIF